MKITFDPEVDAVYILFKEDKIVDSLEQSDNLVYDFNIEGKVVGVEILNFSRFLAEKGEIEIGTDKFTLAA